MPLYSTADDTTAVQPVAPPPAAPKLDPSAIAQQTYDDAQALVSSDDFHALTQAQRERLWNDHGQQLSNWLDTQDADPSDIAAARAAVAQVHGAYGEMIASGNLPPTSAQLDKQITELEPAYAKLTPEGKAKARDMFKAVGEAYHSDQFLKGGVNPSSVLKFKGYDQAGKIRPSYMGMDDAVRQRMLAEDNRYGLQAERAGMRLADFTGGALGENFRETFGKLTPNNYDKSDPDRIGHTAQARLAYEIGAQQHYKYSTIIGDLLGSVLGISAGGEFVKGAQMLTGGAKTLRGLTAAAETAKAAGDEARLAEVIGQMQAALKTAKTVQHLGTLGYAGFSSSVAKKGTPFYAGVLKDSAIEAAQLWAAGKIAHGADRFLTSRAFQTVLPRLKFSPAARAAATFPIAGAANVAMDIGMKAMGAARDEGSFAENFLNAMFGTPDAQGKRPGYDWGAGAAMFGAGAAFATMGAKGVYDTAKQYNAKLDYMHFRAKEIAEKNLPPSTAADALRVSRDLVTKDMSESEKKDFDADVVLYGKVKDALATAAPEVTAASQKMDAAAQAEATGAPMTAQAHRDGAAIDLEAANKKADAAVAEVMKEESPAVVEEKPAAVEKQTTPAPESTRTIQQAIDHGDTVVLNKTRGRLEQQDDGIYFRPINGTDAQTERVYGNTAGDNLSAISGLTLKRAGTRKAKAAESDAAALEHPEETETASAAREAVSSLSPLLESIMDHPLLDAANDPEAVKGLSDASLEKAHNLVLSAKKEIASLNISDAQKRALTEPFHELEDSIISEYVSAPREKVRQQSAGGDDAGKPASSLAREAAEEKPLTEPATPAIEQDMTTPTTQQPPLLDIPRQRRTLEARRVTLRRLIDEQDQANNKAQAEGRDYDAGDDRQKALESELAKVEAEMLRLAGKEPLKSDYTFSKSFSNDPHYLEGVRAKWSERFGKPAETVTLSDIERVATKLKWSNQTKQGSIKERKPLVEAALREGKPVPENVLADYPDLGAKESAPTKEPTFFLKQTGNVWIIAARDHDTGGTARVKTLGGIYTEEQMTNAQKMVDEMNARSGSSLAKPTTPAPEDNGRRYTVVKVLPDGSIHRGDLQPMTHAEAVTFRSKMTNPSDWRLEEVKAEAVEPAKPKEPWQMTRKERGRIEPDTANHGIFKTKKEADARLAELEDTISKSPAMMKILSSFGLRASDAYQVSKSSKTGRWGLAKTHQHEIALAIRDGKSVPPEVMADYPDILATADKPPPVIPSAPESLRDTAPQKHLSPASVTAALRVIANRLKGTMPSTVIANGSEYPQSVKDAAAERGITDLNRIRGVVVDGKIYINAAALENPGQAIETFLHEAAGHGGVDPILNALSKDARAALEAKLRSYFPDEFAYVQRRYRPGEAVSEVMAKLMEQLGPNMSAEKRTLWNKALDYLRLLLNRLGLKSWSRGDVEALLRRGLDSVRKAKPGTEASTDVANLSGTELTYAAQKAGVPLTDEQVGKVVNRDPAVTDKVREWVRKAKGEDAKMSVGGVTPEQDRDYLAAVERGDMAGAQRMVDAAAREAGYGLKLFTGQPRGITEMPETTRNELPFGHTFLTNDREVAAHYSGAMARAGRNTDFGTGRTGRTYRTFVKIEKPLDLGKRINESAWVKRLAESENVESEIQDILYQKDEDALLKKYPISGEEADQSLDYRLEAIAREIERQGDPEGLLKAATKRAAMKALGFEWDADERDFQNNNGTVADNITEAVEGAWSDLSGQGYYLQDALNDSPTGQALVVSPKQVSEKFVTDGGFDGYKFPDSEMGGTTYVVFDPSQIKSADPVTRDNEGNVIPLSERFNPQSNDIRFSLKDDLYDKLKEARASLAAYRGGSEIRDRLPAAYDWASNDAEVKGGQATTSIRLDFQRPIPVGETRKQRNEREAAEELDRKAAAFVEESGGDKDKMTVFRSKVASAKPALAKKWLPIIDHGIANYDALDKKLEGHRTMMKELLADAKAKGLDVGEELNYVTHAVDYKSGEVAPLFSAGNGSRGGGYFTKGRVMDTLADVIAHGQDLKSSDIAKLDGYRTAAQTRLLNRRAVLDEMRSTLAQDGKPVIGTPELTPAYKRKYFDYRAELDDWVTRKQSGVDPGDPPTPPEKETAPPPGYSNVSVMGMQIPIHNQFADSFRSLYENSSAVRRHWLGRAALKAAAWAKSYTLVADTFHIGRVLYKQLTATGAARMGKGKALLEYSDADLDRAVKAGEIDKEDAAFARKNRGLFDDLVTSGLNTGSMADNIVEQAHTVIPGLNKFNNWIFNKLSRSAIAQTGLVFAKRNLNSGKFASHTEAIRAAAKETNEMFGNLQSQGIFKSKTLQDMARLLFLAPQWTEGMLRNEARSYAQIAKGAAGLARGEANLGNSALAMAAGVTSLFVINQLINAITRNKSTLDNEEEGHKFDAWLPLGKNGSWFSPLEMNAEYLHALSRYTSKHENIADALAHIGSNKLSGVGRGAAAALTGRDYAGRKFNTLGERATYALTSALPMPMQIGAVLEKDPRHSVGNNPVTDFRSLVDKMASPLGYRFNRQPGSVAKQILQSSGVKVEMADTPRAQMFALAQPFRADQSPRDPAGKYSELRRALDNNDFDGAKDEVLSLLAAGESRQHIFNAVGFKTDGEVKPELFTGTKATEAKFLKAITPHQRAVYQQAQKDHRENAKKLVTVMRSIKPAPVAAK